MWAQQSKGVPVDLSVLGEPGDTGRAAEPQGGDPAAVAMGRWPAPIAGKICLQSQAQ